MKKNRITHPDRGTGFKTGEYSDGIWVDGLLFVSGQAALDFKNSRFLLGTIEEETHLTMQNIKAIVEQAGMTMEHVLKCTVHLTDINDFDQFNAVYAQYFPGVKPARTTVQSVLAQGIKIEIDCIAKIEGYQS